MGFAFAFDVLEVFRLFVWAVVAFVLLELFVWTVTVFVLLELVACAAVLPGVFEPFVWAAGALELFVSLLCCAASPSGEGFDSVVAVSSASLLTESVASNSELAISSERGVSSSLAGSAVSVSANVSESSAIEGKAYLAAMLSSSSAGPSSAHAVCALNARMHISIERRQRA
ncbi:MAG: hypothetical protein IJF97_07950 [Eggerthellaceae bacterium]|nr:hypothetical protein [Eggerthellaceae bacterium]